MKLESISIGNLRSISSRQTFDLRPLTLVVGANSTGKSTFLRTFPLLRQSVETTTRGPILWFGRFVDFGVFRDAVSRDTSNPDIEFSFEITVPAWGEEAPTGFLAPHLIVLEDTKVNVTLVISATSTGSSTFTKQIRVEAWGRIIEINAAPDGAVQSFLLDGQPLKGSPSHLSIRAGSSLFSMMVNPKSASGRTGNIWAHFNRAYFGLVMEHVKTLFHGSTVDETKFQFTQTLGIGSCSSLTSQVIRLAAVTKTSRTRASHQNSDSDWIKQLQGLVIADRVPQLLNEIDAFLNATFKGMNYIGPLRATAERFYRQQDLAVDEVDPQGANLAMFLMGLGPKQQTAFSRWCEERIGFSVEAKAVGAHVSINLRDSENGGLFNVADMGFGYSQLLPVLATIWRAVTTRGVPRPPSIQGRYRSRSRSEMDFPPKLIAIEQPELHLHPRLQGRLADLMCAIVSDSGLSRSTVHLICETHSETIINRVGELISEGAVDADQVQVLVFEKSEGSLSTSIRRAEYDQDGMLVNWPYGFFLPTAG